MDTVAASRTLRRGLGVVLPFLVGSCGELRSADQVAIRINSDRMTWESADGDLWGIVDLLEKDGVIWVLTSVDPFVHGLQRGEEVVTFGRLGEGPDELRSARALLDRGDAGEITIWDPASRLYRTRLTIPEVMPSDGRALRVQVGDGRAAAVLLVGDGQSRGQGRLTGPTLLRDQRDNVHGSSLAV